MITTSAEMRRCVCCGLEKPTEQFRLRRRGMPDRAVECRRCHSDAERTRRRRHRARKIQRVTRQIVLADDLDQIHRLASHLLEKFGGVKRLTTLYHSVLEAARAVNPASPTVAAMLMAVVRLQVLSESLTSNEPLPDSLEDKRKALGREFSKFILEHPEDIAALLSEVGWRVQPPNGQFELADEGDYACRMVNA